MVTVTDAVGVDRGALGHAQLDDVAAQLGIDDAPQQVHDRRSGVGRAAIWGHGRRFYRPSPCNLVRDVRRHRAIRSTASTSSRRSATTPATPSTSSWPASPLPLSTAEIADVLDLHVNTVRPHLERMRDVGLLEVDTESRGGVGRPQHRYSLAADAPSLGLEPSPFPMLARMLLRRRRRRPASTGRDASTPAASRASADAAALARPARRASTR